MDAVPRLLNGRVWHARQCPRRHAFSYRACYLALPLSRLGELALPVDGPGMVSFQCRDHGPRAPGGDLMGWARAILRDHGLTAADGEIVLLAMPRVLGHVFNPVSFWLCLDRRGELRAVLCEVNNTFGESHSYLCAHPDQRPIAATDRLRADKLFHVSPFLAREGYYRFRFHLGQDSFAVRIDYHDAAGRHTLATGLAGRFSPLPRRRAGRFFLRPPLPSLRVLALIHWQAFRLWCRGLPYHPRPVQRQPRLSVVERLKNS